MSANTLTPRFSLSWARIIKDGDGEINQEGLDHYSKMIDKLLEANIEPFITLFHWDLPYALYKKGGWLNRDITQAFKKYVEAVVDAFGHKVNHFITFNEPQCILGARLGGTLPDAKYSAKDRNTMVHNLLLCHGEAVKVLRKCKNIKIGYAPCNDARIPLTTSVEDIEAARQSYFDVERGDMWGVSVFSDPIILGDYPKKYYEVNRKEDLPDIKDGDLELISQPIDFYCQNIYQGLYVKADGKGGYQIVPPKPNVFVFFTHFFQILKLNFLLVFMARYCQVACYVLYSPKAGIFCTHGAFHILTHYRFALGCYLLGCPAPIWSAAHPLNVCH